MLKQLRDSLIVIIISIRIVEITQENIKVKIKLKIQINKIKMKKCLTYLKLEMIFDKTQCAYDFKNF